MRGSGRRISHRRQFAGLSAAIIFLSASIGTSYANELSLGSYQQGGWAAPTGVAAMLQLRIPFGSDSSRQARPTLSLSAGTTWRPEFASKDFTGFRYMPVIEAGLSFRGDPTLRSGSVDIHKMFAQQWNADNAGSAGTEGSSFCDRNLALCIVGGVVGGIIVIGAVVALAVAAKCSTSLCGVPGE